MGRGGGGGALPDFFFFFSPCSADHERDWSPCKVEFSGLATNTLNVRDNNTKLKTGVVEQQMKAPIAWIEIKSRIIQSLSHGVCMPRSTPTARF